MKARQGGAPASPDAAEQPPALSIVIVSWNVRELLRACLESIAASKGELELEVIVVDGASQDGTLAMLQTDFPAASYPWLQVVPCTENVGFPRGNNIGLQRARGRCLLLLNPDTEVVGDALQKMVSYVETHPMVGALGPQLRYPDGTLQSSRRRFPTVATAFLESTWLEPWAPRWVLTRYRMLDQPDDAVSEVDWVMGAALLVRRRIVEEIGLLDEDYFMYSEELDWCRRIKDAGWRIVYLPEARVIHHEGKSSEQAVTARHIHFQRAKLRYFRKYHGFAAYYALRLFLLASYFWQIGVEGTKGLLGHRRALRRQRIAAYWQVVKSGLRAAGY